MTRVACLRVFSPEQPERLFPLRKEVTTIGRSPRNDLSIPALELSREHALIVRRGDDYYLADRGSRHGTRLRGVPIQGETRLRAQDEILLCRTRLVFELHASSSVELSDAAPRLEHDSVAIPADELVSTVYGGSRRGGRDVLEVLATFSRLLLAETAGDNVLQDVLRSVVSMLRCERAALMLLEGDPPELVSKATVLPADQPPLVLSRAITDIVLGHKTSLITGDAKWDARSRVDSNPGSGGASAARPAMCVPLWNETGARGLLYVDRPLSDRHFDQDDLSLLTVLANLVAAKIQNLVLLEEARKKREWEERLRLAAEIQESLLPAVPPKHGGWEFAGCSLPADLVGGDFFDYVPRRADKLGLAVGDISGKGIDAALLMVALHATLRNHAQTAPDLAEMLLRVNRAIHNARGLKFATVMYVELDLPAARANYVSAGHNLGLLIRRDGRVETLSLGGQVLGAHVDPTEYEPYEIGSFFMAPRDVLVLYTDGVVDTLSHAHSGGGDAMLRQWLCDARHLSAEEILQNLVDHLEEVGPARQLDDVTLLVAKRL